MVRMVLDKELQRGLDVKGKMRRFMNTEALLIYVVIKHNLMSTKVRKAFVC